MMSKLNFHAVMMCLVAAIGSSLASAQPTGTEFTYQGQLLRSGQPLNDSADFRCTLWNAWEGGEMVGLAQQVSDVAVIDGLFNLVLDFGAEAFNGEPRWLQIAVRSPAGVDSFTTMQQRQALTATPYALQTRGITVNESGNRIGIGTVTPNATLHVVEESDAAGLILIDSGVNVAQYSAIDFHDRGVG